MADKEKKKEHGNGFERKKIKLTFQRLSDNPFSKYLKNNFLYAMAVLSY